jgi:hypothetical protein
MVYMIGRTALGPTQPPIQWVPGALSLGVKRPRREADHSPPSSAEVKKPWSYTSTPQYAYMPWCLVKHRDNFTAMVKERAGGTLLQVFAETVINSEIKCFDITPGKFLEKNVLAALLLMFKIVIFNLFQLHC